MHRLIAQSASRFNSFSNERALIGVCVCVCVCVFVQADERKHDLKTELRILMVHGLLHLLGYDHETCEEDLVSL